MCGIAGLFAGAREEPISELQLRSMTDRIQYRGPDSDGFYCQPRIGLGMRRLRIIDLSTGDQPICNEDGTIWTVFNGEIYNFADLRADLIRKGHLFKTQTDTEVIVHQYEEDGERCVEKFRGMFAFAVWDARKQSLVLARDRFGIKPLFVAEQNGCLAFGSEMKALFSLPWIERLWNPVALRAYLRLGYIPCPLTPYQGIRKFKQGTVEVWEKAESGCLHLQKRLAYWSPSATVARPMPSFEQAASDLMCLLKESVRLRLRSDVPLGAFLSGGVDSTSVVALMRLCGARDLRTFSIGFEDTRFNELPYAALAAEHLDTQHYTQVVTSADAHAAFDFLASLDEPFADSSAIPTYFVSRLAREHVTVSLSGDGGDELFAGYAQYPMLERYRVFDRLPQRARHVASQLGARLIAERGKGGGWVRRLGVPADQRLLSLVSHPLNGYLSSTLSPALRDFLSGGETDAIWQDAFQCENSVTAAQIVDQSTYLADDILVKVDRASMAVSLEARVPLLDHHLAEYVNALPASYKLFNGHGKRLLRHVMESHIPVGVLCRPKMGFGIPLRSWLMGPLSHQVNELILDNPAGLFELAEVRDLIAALRDGGRDLSDQVWKLLSLAIWADRQAGFMPW